MQSRKLNTHLFLVALCLAPSPIAHAYAPDSGSAVAGDLSSVPGPYGIPADKFASATQHADASAAFNITGYNVSADAGTNSPVAVSGWTLTARVTTDVALSDANDSSLASQKTEATTLYLEAPGNMGAAMGAQWRLCAVVYPGTASAVANSTSVDGTCNGVLSAECLQALTASAGGSEDTGLDNSGNCTNFALPSRCTNDFPAGSGNLSAITINQTVLDNKRFYAYGSDPTSSDNSTAQVEAKDNVWPVITIFGHVSSGGQLSSANTAVQCVRAINGTTTDDIGSSAVARFGEKRSLFAAIGAALVASWVSMV